jgi:hypothetical protein
MVHELYYKFKESYTKLSPCIYAFPSDTCVLGFQFIIEEEAKEMEKQIRATSPEKRGLFTNLFHRKARVGNIPPLPYDSDQSSGGHWNSEPDQEPVSDCVPDTGEEHQESPGQRDNKQKAG